MHLFFLMLEHPVFVQQVQCTCNWTKVSHFCNVFLRSVCVFDMIGNPTLCHLAWISLILSFNHQQVLQHVRLPLLNPKFLVGTVSTDLLIRSDEACRDLVDEAKNYLLLPQERPLMQGPRTRPRKPIRCGEVLFAGGSVYFWECLCFILLSTPVLKKQHNLLLRKTAFAEIINLLHENLAFSICACWV